MTIILYLLVLFLYCVCSVFMVVHATIHADEHPTRYNILVAICYIGWYISVTIGWCFDWAWIKTIRLLQYKK